MFIRARAFKINPFALRKAKIAHNFGLSECNRVNMVYGLQINIILQGHLVYTLITLNIGTPRPATVVVLNIKQFNFTLK